jgi:hypothetical protein
MCKILANMTQMNGVAPGLLVHVLMLSFFITSIPKKLPFNTIVTILFSFVMHGRTDLSKF